MSAILRKIGELFGFKRPDKEAMMNMKGMEHRALESNSMAALPGEMEMARMQPQKRQPAVDKAMGTSTMSGSSMEGHMMEDPMPSAEENMQMGKRMKKKM